MSSTKAKENQSDSDTDHTTEQLPILSPDDKLRGTPAPGSEIPGAENPQSTEVKKETNPNTE